MSGSLAQLLNERGADADTVQQAARYVVAEVSGYATYEDMERLVGDAGSDGPPPGELRALLETDGAALNSVCANVLAAAWNDPQHHDKAVRAIEGAKTKLAVIELSLLALVAMYGLWLEKTGGIKRTEVTLERRPDGTWIEREATEFYGPDAPLRAVGDVLRSSTQPHLPPGDSPDSEPRSEPR